MFRKRKLCLIISAAALAAPVVGVADDGFKIEEITVTATRRATTTMDVPYNISATTSETLSRVGITDLSKLSRTIPGLSYVDMGARNSGINNNLSMRGMQMDSMDGGDRPKGAVGTVSTYVGETPMFVNLKLKDIDRVEVLRGPQGTLYGSGSMGGTLRYIPKRPDTEEFSADINTKVSFTKEADGYNTDTDVVINLPLNEKMALRAVVGYEDKQGFIDATRLVQMQGDAPALADPNDVNSGVVRYSKDDINGDRGKVARLSFLWDVSDDTSLLLSYDHQEVSADGRQVDNTAKLGKYKSGVELPENMDRTVKLYAAELKAAVGGVDISSSTSYYRNDASTFRDKTGAYDTEWHDTYAHMPRMTAHGHVKTEDDAFVQELRLQSAGEGDIAWVGGLYYSNQHTVYDLKDYIHGWNDWVENPAANTAMGPWDYASYTVPTEKDMVFPYKDVQHAEEKAVFGELTYHVSDAWQVTVGARFFEIDFESSKDMEFIFFDAVATGSSEESSKDHIFKFNTSYDIDNDTMAYFTFSQGFRRGGANGTPVYSFPALHSSLAGDEAYTSFESDSIDNWEVGLKGTMAEDRIQYTASAYYIDWQNPQVAILTPNGGFGIAHNAKSAESKGLELELKARPMQGLDVSLGYSYTSAQLTDDFNIPGKFNANPTGGARIQGADIVKGADGDKLAGVPEHMATLSLDYFQELDSGLTLVYHLNANYKDVVKTTISEKDPDYQVLDSYALVDLSIGLEASDWQVKLFVDNVTDKRAALGARAPTNFGQFHQFSYVNRPRTIGASLSYHF